MADTKKFLDQAGVSVLWNAVAAELAKKAAADTVYTKTEVDNKIAASAYNDTAVKADIKANADAITVLNSDAGVEGSVAYKITKMVLENDGGSVDKLTEIAAWIANHPTDAAEYNQRITNNKEAIDALKLLVGSESVADQIAQALEESDLSQYASAQDLADAIVRIAANETAIGTLQTTVGGHGTRLSAVEAKAGSNETAIGNLSGRLNGIVAQGGEPNVINNIKVNGVVQAITDKAVDIAVPVIEALSEAEIKTACGLS